MHLVRLKLYLKQLILFSYDLSYINIGCAHTETHLNFSKMMQTSCFPWNITVHWVMACVDYCSLMVNRGCDYVWLCENLATWVRAYSADTSCHKCKTNGKSVQ